MTAPRILIMAGGTGGHVFPALAVAELLEEAGASVEWLGTRRGIESRLVPGADIPIHYIQVSGLRGKGLLSLLKAPWQIIRAVSQAFAVIRRIQPQCVLGMGGFVAGPGGVAAWLLRKPVVIHEQNAVAGTTNKLLAGIAAQTLLGYPINLGARSRFIGNPVRRELLQLPPPSRRWAQRSGSLRLLVLGGSLGAKPLNDVMPRFLNGLPADQRPAVWHQTGDQHIGQVRHRYQQAGLEARVDPFIHDMAAAYGWADLVLCRAGALTVAELMAVGIGAILVPLPHAIDDHQTRNAQWLAEQHAAVLLPQSELTPERLLALWAELAVTRDALCALAKKAHALAKPDASRQVADCCLALAKPLITGAAND